MKGHIRVHYDEEGDFLEINIGKPSESYAEEIKPGIFVRRDEKTGEVKSISILSFKKRTKTQENIEVSIPVEISLSA